MVWFSWFKQSPIDVCSGISARTSQLLAQMISDENLEQAFDRLCQQNTTQDHSNVWGYRRDWSQHKLNLQTRINTGTYSSQHVREVKITDEQGYTSRREIRCAEDRLLIRAMAQVLKPAFGEALSTDSVHLTGNDGLKASVTQVEDYISQRPNHQVIKSSVDSDQTTVVTIAVNVFFNIPFVGEFTDYMKYLVSSAHQLRVTWLGQSHINLRAN